MGLGEDMLAKDLEVLQADIRWLAKRWESLLGHIDYPTKTFSFVVLDDLVLTFCRGRGLRLGSYTQRQRYGRTTVDIMAAIVAEVARSKAADLYFPTLRAMGYDTVGGADEIITQVRERHILKEYEA